jgi:hypothetical protein
MIGKTLSCRQSMTLPYHFDLKIEKWKVYDLKEQFIWCNVHAKHILCAGMEHCINHSVDWKNLIVGIILYLSKYRWSINYKHQGVRIIYLILIQISWINGSLDRSRCFSWFKYQSQRQENMLLFFFERSHNRENIELFTDTSFSFFIQYIRIECISHHITTGPDQSIIRSGKDQVIYAFILLIFIFWYD